MSLKDDGFRFMVSHDRKGADWFYLPDDRCAGWVDCTDMSDEEFDRFMTGEMERQ